MTDRPPRPRFYGIRTYIDPDGRFRFRYPTGWHEFALEDREGVMYAPEAENPRTWFSVWITALDEAVVAEDIEDLRAGVDEGLAQLSDCQVESASEQVLSNLIKFERVYTFADEGTIRKRKVWLLYVDRWLIVATWQGETVEEYHYWLPMGNYAFAHFTLPPELWFATDRDLNAERRA
jgi:hypothetical protein